MNLVFLGKKSIISKWKHSWYFLQAEHEGNEDVEYVNMAVHVFMCTFAHAEALQADQPSTSGVIKCDAALGN